MKNFDNSLTFERPHRSFRYRLLDRSVNLLSKLGSPVTELSEKSLLRAACKQTGLNDFGDESFRLPLKKLIESLETEANLNFTGKYLLRQYFIKLLINRLKIQEQFNRYPEIFQVQIKKPVFVLGLPRCGTTFLFNLLCQDSNTRWLRLWELMNPCPPPVLQASETDPRIQQAEKSLKLYDWVAPNLKVTHYYDPRGPEECNKLFEHNFVSPLFAVKTNIPSYYQWLVKQENLFTSSYKYYRQQLQLLSWKYQGKHWILKAPFHLSRLDSILKVFPDACFVHIHRNPLNSVPSGCSLSALWRGIYSDRVDTKIIGQQWLNWLADATERMMNERSQTHTEHFFDSNYDDMIADPVDTLRQIYNHFKFDYTTRLEENLKQYINQNSQHKRGVHVYSLEQFNLEPIAVSQKFIKYRKQFNI